MEEKKIETRDLDADAAIMLMMGTVIGTAIIPAAVNWGITATAMGVGCVEIGKAYGANLTKENGKKLVLQFIKGAGLWFLAMQVGSKALTTIIEFTGVGYAAGIALDAATSAAYAWAIGKTAKSYFRAKYLGGELSKQELGEIFRKSFKEKKEEVKNKKEISNPD